MNDVQQAAFELRLDDLRKFAKAGHDLTGCLLSANSAHEADSRQQLAIIRFLVKSGVSVKETDKNGVTSLHRAVRFRSLSAVNLLLDLGADVNATDRRSQSTPLHRAVTSTGAPSTEGKQDVAVDIAKTLLKHGANAQFKNKNGKTPGDYVKNEPMKAVFKF